MELLARLAIELPIIQAPMAGVSTPALAAAVSEEGALGSISVGAVDAETARAWIREVRERTRRSFAVNVFCHEPARRDAVAEAAWIARHRTVFERLGAPPPVALREIYRSFVGDEDMLRVLLDERPPVVSFHFGLPRPDQIAALRGAGIVLLATATSVDEAYAIAASGIDAVVAQGIEAGGHRGVFDPAAPDARLGALALVRQIARDVDLPAIAAGGIMDGAGIAEALAAGASAAQLGTAFVACPESVASPGHKAALAGGRTLMTSAISGRPARGLQNRLTAIVDADDAEIPAYPVAYDLAKALMAAAQAHGAAGFGAWWAGQGAALARTMPAGQLVRVLAAELEAARAHA